MHAVAASVRLVEPRVLRRVIRKHRHGSSASMGMPHGIGYALPVAAALELTTAEERGDDGQPAPEGHLLLVPRGDTRDAEEELRQRWRAIFHLSVHVALEDKRRDGTLTEAIVRARRHRIGQTELDEIRSVFRHDDLLLPNADEIDEYIEVVAFFCELSAFAPRTLSATFPGLDPAQVAETIALDVDAVALLAASKPEGAGPAIVQRALPSTVPTSSSAEPLASGRTSRVTSADELDQARTHGNVVRAAIEGADPRLDLRTLVERLSGALAGAPLEIERLADGLVPLVSTAQRSPAPTLAIEARILYDLQRACLDVERPSKVVDVFGAIGSLFRRKIVRTQPARNLVQFAHSCRRAVEKLPRTRLPPTEREEVGKILRELEGRAQAAVRAALRPKIAAAIAAVGLRPGNVPEQVAEHKIVEELVDHVIAQGTLSLPHLRDAVARNHLKCADVGPVAFVMGDELLRADKVLSLELDGVYRRGEIYLRGLQKLSSLAFGTRVGRFLTMYLVLPVLGAFVILEGLSHLAHPIARKLFHVRHFHLLTRPSLAVVSVLLFALLHSAAARKVAAAVASGLFAAIHGLLIGLPVWLCTRPFVLAIARSLPVKLALRFIAKPLTVAAPAYLLARRGLHLHHRPALLAAAISLPVASMVMNARWFSIFEEICVDALSRGARNVKKRVVPGILTFFLDLVRAVVEWLERVIYFVGERLLTREGESTVALALKGVASAVFGVFTFLARFYVNLLIEPQVNPIKHFPVVTVSHKIILPMLPTLVTILRAPLIPIIGSVAANTIAGVTVFLLPGVFGFLAWELKENRRLYAAARPRELQPVRIGSHGETMTGLLVPGFHSGTIPAVESRIRKSTRRVDRREPFWKLALRQRTRAEHDLHHVAEALSCFVERELLALLERTARWKGGPLSVGGVILGSNRVRISIVRGDADGHAEHGHATDDEALVVAFEEQSGYILSERVRDGFLATAAPSDRQAMLEALEGLYRLADVDFTREALSAAVGGRPYDVCDDGLAVWSMDWTAEVMFDLRAAGPTDAVVRAGKLELGPLDPTQLRLTSHPVEWATWTRSWSAVTSG